MAGRSGASSSACSFRAASIDDLLGRIGVSSNEWGCCELVSGSSRDDAGDAGTRALTLRGTKSRSARRAGRGTVQAAVLWREGVVVRADSALPLVAQVLGTVALLLLLARVLGRVAPQTCGARLLHRWPLPLGDNRGESESASPMRSCADNCAAARQQNSCVSKNGGESTLARRHSRVVAVLARQ